MAKTPYTVRTDEDGTFSIANIPAGTYNLKGWHEKLGESEPSVVVKAGITTKINNSLELSLLHELDKGGRVFPVEIGLQPGEYGGHAMNHHVARGFLRMDE